MNGKQRNFLSLCLGRCFALMIGIITLSGCTLTPKKIEEDDSYIYEADVHCYPLLLSTIRHDGSFFGSNSEGDYMFEFNHKSDSPWLIFRAKGLSHEKTSTFYGASRIHLSCKEFSITFDEVVPHPDGPAGGLLKAKPNRQIRLIGELFYGNLDEGEFRNTDLRAKILSTDGIKPAKQVKLFIAGRYKNAATETLQTAAKTLDRMSQERCGLTHSVAENRKEFEECILSLKSAEIFTLPPDL
jgi:hypothetical protein